MGIIVILLFGLTLRLISLNQSLWLDEAINVTAARDLGLVDLITNYSLGDFHPPLYHLLLHPWIRLFGDSEISVRLPSIIFGLFTIYFTSKISQYLLGQHTFKIPPPLTRLHPRLPNSIPLALLPPLLLATSGLHIYYSQEARMYSLASMLATLSIYCLLKFLKAHSITSLINLTHKSLYRPQILFHSTSLSLILALTFMLYSDYVVWLLLPLFFITAPIHSLLSLALTLPWIPYFFQQLHIGLSVAASHPGWGAVVGGFSLKSLALIPVKFLIGRISLDDKTLYFLLILPPLILAISLIYISLKRLKLSHKPIDSIPTIWLFSPLVLAAAISLRISILSYFRFLFILPAFYILISASLPALKPKLQTHLVIALLILNLVTSISYLLNPKFHREDWRGFSNWINQSPTQEAVTLFPSLSQSAPYYYYQHRVKALDSIQDPLLLPDTVYLVRYVQEIFDPADTLRLTLEDLGYAKTQVKHFNGVVVWVYQKPSRLFASNHPITNSLLTPKFTIIRSGN